MKIPEFSALDRRQVLQLLAGTMLVPLVGCGDDAGGVEGMIDGGTGTSPDSGGAAGSCSKIPEETEGPYPGDGSNGPNVLTTSGVVRKDIRTSFGSLSGTAGGVQLTVELTLVQSGATCAPLAGAAVYLWHCDREGRYSLYSAGATDQNYLRGVQEAGADGKVTFTSVFPGCYSGRWPHIHFEVYASLAQAMSVQNKIATSQLALPVEACRTVYATTGYMASVNNLANVTLQSDGIFRDGSSQQLAETTGNVTDGFVSKLVVAAR